MLAGWWIHLQLASEFSEVTVPNSLVINYAEHTQAWVKS